MPVRDSELNDYEDDWRQVSYVEMPYMKFGKVSGTTIPESEYSAVQHFSYQWSAPLMQEIVSRTNHYAMAGFGKKLDLTVPELYRFMVIILCIYLVSVALVYCCCPVQLSIAGTRMVRFRVVFQHIYIYLGIAHHVRHRIKAKAS